MTDYSKLSDMEIAQKVWFWWQHKVDHDNSLCGASGAGLLYQKGGVWVLFDPCNNAADAWPIIVGNAIGVMPFKKGESESWSLAAGLLSNTTVKHQNPLRAAMLVFLMMNEGE